MVKRITTIAVFAVSCLCVCNDSQGQYGGIRMQVGSYGSDVYVDGFGYGNGLSSDYGRIYGYRNPYSYGSYERQNIDNGYNGNGYNGNGYNDHLGYSSYPDTRYSYGPIRRYAAPMRLYSPRRFR